MDNLDMFPLVPLTRIKDITALLMEIMETTEQNIHHYFPPMTIDSNPFKSD